MRTCLFCLDSLIMPINNSTYLYCPACKPTPFFTGLDYRTSSWAVYFEFWRGKSKYRIVQVIGTNQIDVSKVISAKDEWCYNLITTFSQDQSLTPNNAKHLLDRILNMKAFL